MTAKRDSDHITPLKARSKRFRDQRCIRGHPARAAALVMRYQEQLDQLQVEELEGVEVSSSSKGYVSGSEEVCTVGTNDTDKSWQPQHVGDIVEQSTCPVSHHSLLGSVIQHGSEGSRVHACSGEVQASKEEIHLRAAGAPRRYCTAKQLCSTLTQFWQSFSGMRCVTKSQAASHGCPHSEVYNNLGVKPYFMFPTCKGEKFRKLFRRAHLFWWVQALCMARRREPTS
jgi:hypothetical protein